MSENYPPHTEIAPKVHLIRGKNRGRFPEANSIYIDDETRTLIDAGSSMDHIEATLNDCGREVKDIDLIILTHFHIDHKGHAAEIMEIADCDLICHPLATKGVRSLEGTIEFYGIAGHKFFNDWRHLIDLRLPHVTGEYEVTGQFEDSKPIDLGQTELIPIHAPGHTEDHTLFGINGTDTIFLVDIDLTRFGPWYGNAVSDVCDFQESIREVIDLEPKMGISSHLINPVTDTLHERLEAYLAIFKEREDRILRNIEQGLDTIDKLAGAPTIYPRIPREAYLIFEEYMIEKHLEDLVKRNMIMIEDGVIHTK